MHFLRADQDLTRHSYYAATAVRDAPHPALQGDVHTAIGLAVVIMLIETI